MAECTKRAKFETCQLDPCMRDPCKPEPNIVIVGAGMAGLSAAHRLVQCGFQNFTVLEATDRYAYIQKMRQLANELANVLNFTDRVVESIHAGWAMW